MDGQEFYKITGGLVCNICDGDCNLPTHKNRSLKHEGKFLSIMKNLHVLYRAHPECIFSVVLGLKQKGHTVAVIASGTNMVPSLKAANVGYCMGISSTEAARDASDILLLDDNIRSAVKSLIWGRHLHMLIRKFVQFQVCSISVLILVSLIAGVVLRRLIFEPIHYLWVYNKDYFYEFGKFSSP